MGEQAQRLLVVEDLYEMPDDGFHHELVHGLLVSEPLPGGRHGRIAANFAERIGRHVREHRLGVVLICDAGFVLHRSPDTVRGPDVAFVSLQRYETLEDETKAIPGPPDLAIEVLSPHDRPSAIHGKVADYLAAGTSLVWVVDPDSRKVTAYRTLFDPQVAGPDETLTADDILPGFRAPVAELFEI